MNVFLKNLQSKAQQETVEGCKEETGVTNQVPWERGSCQQVQQIHLQNKIIEMPKL